FDWIWMEYAQMSYIVKSDRAFSAAFWCLIGLLTGDTASSGFWNVYFADFQLLHDDNDIQLNGRPVCQLEQADDGAIFMTYVPKLQGKIDIFYLWLRCKFMFISPSKSKYMIFGPLPAILPVLCVGEGIVELVPKFKYVGMWFTSTHRNMFMAHYADKASKARKVANTTFGTVKGGHLDSLPVKEGLRLYMAWVDCYLISGGEISLDIDESLLEEHVKVQQLFLRNLLGLNPASMCAILYTETGQTLIKVRCLLRALSRLRYLLAIPASEDRIVWDALLHSFLLYRSGKPCWIGDITLVLSRLPSPIHVTEDDLHDDKMVQDIMEWVEAVLDADLQGDIDTFMRTHLLCDRVERIDESEGKYHMGHGTRRHRHYLDVPIPTHWKALTLLMLSDHNLSVERLRYPGCYRAAVPRDLQLCRFCHAGVEDESHALLVCKAHGSLEPLRDTFLREIADTAGGFEGKWSPNGAYKFLKWLLSVRKITLRLAKFPRSHGRCVP
ncbi:hypothetical protein B0H17DRAFT_951227, partial [Mycena rosella]